MSVVVVGLRERDSSLDVLERIAVGDDQLDKTLTLLLDSPEIDEAVVVSTCMRTEVYAVLERFHEGVDELTTFFTDRLGGPDAGALADVLFVAYDDAAVRHLFDVAAGLDSAVLGEGEILRQVRSAAERALDQRASGPILTPMFRHALEVGKRARTDTSISRGSLSLAHVAVEIASEHLDGPIADARIVVAGAGEMGEGIVRALGDRGAGSATVVLNRSPSAARELAERIGGRAGSVADLALELAEADVLLTATASDEPLVDRALVESAIAGRPGRPLVVVDAAVPRDVEPAVGTIAGVTLADVDAIRRRAEGQMDARRGEVSAVAAIVDEELERFRQLQRGRAAAPLVTTLRTRAEQIVLDELARVRGGLDDDAFAAASEATRRVVAKLLHEPTAQLKSAAGSARGERLAEALRILFDL